MVPVLGHPVHVQLRTSYTEFETLWHRRRCNSEADMSTAAVFKPIAVLGRAVLNGRVII